MTGADDLSPPSTGVANLTLVLGIGALGERVIAELGKLLEASEAGHRGAMVCWSHADQGHSPAAAAGQLLSNRNLDALEQAGYQVPGRSVGQPPRLSVVYIVDTQDQTAGQTVDSAREDLKSLASATNKTIIPLGTGQITDVLGSDVVSKRAWELIVPVSAQDRVAGVRSESDLVATVARMVFVFSVANQPHFASRVLGGIGSSAAVGISVVRIGAAFLDSGKSELLEVLSKSMAAGLLERQFENLVTFQPEPAFDDQRRTKLLALVKPEVLLGRLLADTPFTLSTGEGEAWRVELPKGIVAAELHRVPKRRWVAVLQKLRDLFDFTKARRWAESVERSEVALLASVQEVISEDVRQLHHYERGPDRLLAWASAARDILESQPEIARSANADIEVAIGELRAQIKKAPNPIAVWARVALLGWIGATGVRYIVGGLFGYTIGLIAFIITLTIAALLGFRLIERAHHDLQSARNAAQDALIRRYEAQMRENLILVLNRVRSRLIATLEEEVGRARNQAQRANAIAREMAAESDVAQTSDLVNVECVVPAHLRGQFFESLNVPWSTLQRQAAAEGAFMPAPPDGDDCLKKTVEVLVGFAERFLKSRLDDLSFEGLVAFRAQEDPNFSERIVRDLDRRAAALAGRAPLRTSWHGPSGALARFHDKIVALAPDADEQSSDAAIVGCIKVCLNISALPGGSE